MSFASGFAAGSQAVQRGLDLRDRKNERDREAAYRDAVKAYNTQFEGGVAADQQAVDAYNASVPTVQPNAVPITTAAGLNPMAQAGVAPPAAPDVQRTVTDVATPPTGLGDQARGVVTGPAPTIRSESDRLRGLGNIALEYGDRAGAANFFGQARQIDQSDENFQRIDRRLGLMGDRLDLATDQFEEGKRQFDEQQELREQQRKDALKSTDALIKYHNANTDRLVETVNQLKQSNARQADIYAGEDATFVLLNGGTMDQVSEQLQSRYAKRDEAGNVVRDEAGNIVVENQDGYMIAANAALSKYYVDHLGMDNLGQAGAVSERAINPLIRAVEANKDPGSVDENAFVSSYNNALKTLVDPDFSDGIDTQLTPVLDDTGQPTGQYQLVHGNQVLENFASREAVNTYAAQQRDAFMDSPFALVSFMENEKRAMLGKATAAKDAATKRKLVADYVTKNPFVEESDINNFYRIIGLSGLEGGLDATGSRFSRNPRLQFP